MACLPDPPPPPYLKFWNLPSYSDCSVTVIMHPIEIKCHSFIHHSNRSHFSIDLYEKMFKTRVKPRVAGEWRHCKFVFTAVNAPSFKYE